MWSVEGGDSRIRRYGLEFISGHAPGWLLSLAAEAAALTALDTGVVERGVMRAKVAPAAIPQRHHCGYGVDGG